MQRLGDMRMSRWLLVVVGATSLLTATAACESTGGSSDAGTGPSGPIVIQATERVRAESLGTCGGCHVVLDEVLPDGISADVVPDVRLYLEHAEMLLAHDLGEP